MVDAEIKQRCERLREQHQEWVRDEGIDPLGEDYRNPYQAEGATEAQLQALMKFAGCPLPEDYLDFLRFSNGFHDFSPVEDVLEDSLSFQEHEASGIVIGDDGGEGVLVLDLRSGASAMSYAYMPTELHTWEDVDGTWPDFSALFLDITPSEIY